MEMKIFRSESWKKVEPFFEVIGAAVALTLVQMVALYLVFQLDVFELYKAFFNKFLFVFDYLYLLFIYVMSKIFGDSLLNVEVFMKMFERMFFIIFLVNLGYFAYSRFRK
ncbi:MAG: hypothetical protein QME59_06860 [Candidatus Hydrothermarchaeota archaeon]|nr:hypothetical protein [Candidatus Hydrothermarchaeota archaeon]